MGKEMMLELVDGLLAIMESLLVRIVLYGSVARGVQTEESDIDIALLIDGTLDDELEDKLSEFIVDMNLKYDKVFSVIDINYEQFKKWEKV
ncbi:MAG: nucleotidyltransferase domain-containing protein, partial [Syntrophaceticus schinkii]